MSSADLANNLGNVSAVLSVSGTTFEQTLGMLTSITEVTRNASKASRGLVQISSRLTQVLDDQSSTGQKLKDIYSGLNIELFDNEGQIRSTYDILEDLSKQWDNLSKNEQEYIALTSAGSNQVQNFSALMENFAVAIDATTTAYNSSGSAMQENEKAMDSIDKKVQLLRRQFERLILGDGGLQNLAKTLLDVGVTILKFANSDVGQLIIQTTLLVTAVTSVIKVVDLLKASKVVSWASETITAIQLLGEAMLGLATKTATASDAYAGLELVLGQLGLTPVVAVMIALAGATVLAYNKYKEFANGLSESADKLSSVKTEADSATQEVESLTQSLENIQQQLEDINDRKLKITDSSQLTALQEQSAELKEQENTLKRQLALAIQKANVAKEEADRQAKEALSTKSKSQFVTPEDLLGTSSIYRPGSVSGTTPQEEMQRAIDKYTELERKREELQRQLDREENAVGRNSARYAELSSRMEDLKTEQNDVIAKGSKVAEVLDSANSSLMESDPLIENQLDGWYSMTGAMGEVDNQIQTLSDDEEDFNDDTEDVNDSIDKLASTLKLTNSQLERYSALMQDEDLEAYLQKLVDIRSALDDASDSIDNLQSALETAVEAQAEYEANGKLTLDTFQSLMSVNAEYLVALQNENGQIEINQTTLGNFVETMKAAKIQELQQAAAADILAYSQGNVADMSDFAKGIVADLGNNIETTGKQASASATQLNKFALGVGTAIEAMGGTVSWRGNAQRAILQGYKDIAKQISELTIDTTAYGNASSSAHKKSSNATKSEKSALDQLKDKYKDVINFILDGYDKQIDKLEDTRDAEIGAIEDKIDAVEKEKDAQLDAIDTEIDALEKERDARKEYWDAQLDALDKNNDATEDAITLQEKLNALATAQQTKKMVMKDGRFQYVSDEEDISSAQSDLDEFNREQEYKRQKELLEKLRDDELNNYDERLDALQDFRDEREKYYDDLKTQLEEQKNYLKEYYEDRINDLKAQKEATKELLENGVKDQKEYEDKMLAQLGNFVADWNATVGAMSFPDISGSGIDVGSITVSQTSSGSGSSGGSSTKTTTTTTTKPKTTTTTPKGTTTKGGNIHVKGGRIMAYASGTNSVRDDEIALVGDNPKYSELVIGSKLNNNQGTLMSLSSGSGVVNADSTRTLASIFNSLSGQTSASFANNGLNNGTTISIGSISLPEVKDGQGFVDYMQHFSTDITQQSFKRI